MQTSLLANSSANNVVCTAFVSYVFSLVLKDVYEDRVMARGAIPVPFSTTSFVAGLVDLINAFILHFP